MSGPNGDPNVSAEDGIIDDEDEFEDEGKSHVRMKNLIFSCIETQCVIFLTEYAVVNSMLDQINSYLDDLEERNDALNGKLHELLESNRQARLEFRAQLQSAPISNSGSSMQEGKEESNEPQDNDKNKD